MNARGLLIGPAVARLGTRHALITGLLSGSLGMAIYGLAPTDLWGVPGPSLLVWLPGAPSLLAGVLLVVAANVAWVVTMPSPAAGRLP